ncbi:DJ-1 family glyoxalase III [Prolixibacter denitrificans]|jgi:4-methyl-5(b-hydroxyethyl)-thiazole monophosphate biosynthesis|uniref:4-methyl-5(B-hydroxyethyl)-thiazole monophosphate biosynthesis n=1 Tax=Prolixibacter denitrificans TaxID=1541063 RepID=A0A2P8CAD6_9BACT|nr:DJ-1 family glyoxalase III [Prolixibacter denitrificans]PSK81925.1 4-methyl-5(b-hydroxyethyl)-thiazole monophosphate biosynthesis [Prolixibacter denitrificans]GET22522.1 thiazole biosynthesis protein ThiJ [Prolixibacter denitrificans]
MTSIAVHLAEGFEEIEAISIIDVLRRARLDVTTVSVTGKKEVKGSHNIPVVADKLFEDVNYDDIEMIVLPGGMPGARHLNEHEGLKNQIKAFAAGDKPLGAICAAPMVLGELGLLEGKKAVCYPGFEKHLKGATVLTEPTLQCENIVMGRGAGVAIKFALRIVEFLEDKKVAEKLAESMLVE